MNDQMKRSWWPFEVIPERGQSEQHKAEIAFLRRAFELGCRAYAEGSDLGAVADDGRECRIEWRGNHRRELFLIDADKAVRREVFASRDEGAAFREAADVALAWLSRRAASPLHGAAADLGTGDSHATSLPIRGAAPQN